MTAPALIKKSDLKRIAEIANSENVSFVIEAGDKKITVFPEIHNGKESDTVDPKEDIVL